MAYIDAAQYTKSADMIAAAKAIRDRLWKPAKVNVAPPVPKPAKDVCTLYRGINVLELRDGKACVAAIPGTAKQFVMMRCKELGINYLEIQGHRRQKDISNARTLLIAEVYQLFPLMSLPCIGKIFDKDHTSILAAVRRAGVYRGQKEMTAIIPSQEELLTMFDYNKDTGILTWLDRDISQFSSVAAHASFKARWAGKEVGFICAEGYRKMGMKKSVHSVHKIIWKMVYGEDVPYPEFEIDHINGVRTDNRIKNLRKVTKSENQRNAAMRKNNQSGVMGVNWVKSRQRWVCRIWDGKIHKYLGQFAHLEDAKICRERAERVLGYHEGHGKPAISKALKGAA